MSELLTAAQMRAIEQAAIESGEVTGLELMERAGRGVVEAIFEEWPELKAKPDRAIVLCGPGNNGGDGFVVARILFGLGWDVEVFAYGEITRLPPDAGCMRDLWLQDGKIEAWPDDPEIFPTRFELHQEPALVIDALFGTGLKRQIGPDVTLTLAALSSYFPSRYARWVAVDLPSGICSDSGRLLVNEFGSVLGQRIAITVTFHRKKLGHLLAAGPLVCRKIIRREIGLRNRAVLLLATMSDAKDKANPPVAQTACETTGPKEGDWLFAEILRRPSSTHNVAAHKYAHGHAVILSGPAGKGGAARLAARGALRIGAGLVTLAGPSSVQYEHCAQITAIMWREIKGAPGLSEYLEDERLNALCLGPGLGLGQGTAHLVLAALKARRATVLDADALTQFQRDPQVLFDALHENVVLTPHAGEFARLFPDIAENLNAPATKGPAYSKVDATREAAARAGCTVLFKGPDTVIADQTGAARINSAHYYRAAPWLATAGSGDVLSGFITGLLARGFAPLEAASTAAWLHVECALSFGPALIAEDLPEELPKVFRSLGL